MMDNQKLAKFLMNTSSIAYIATSERSIDILKQEFIQLIPYITDAYIKNETGCQTTDSFYLHVESAKEIILFPMQFLNANDPLCLDKEEAIESCWHEFETYLQTSLILNEIFFDKQR